MTMHAMMGFILNVVLVLVIIYMAFSWLISGWGSSEGRTWPC